MKTPLAGLMKNEVAALMKEWGTGMIDTNYRIEALEYLLDKECLSEKYYPLIPFKKKLILQSNRMGYKTKNEIAELSDAELLNLGLLDDESVGLLRRFLRLYDPKPQKFKEIEKLNLDWKEKLAFRELYYLPGVKQTRASLYFLSGYGSLISIADADFNEILEKTALAISAYDLSCVVPFPKEARTHIAVARAFTQNR